MSTSSLPSASYCSRHCLRTRITSLSTETLALIFILGASARADHPEDLHEATSFPILVSHVSRRWRTIALCTPRLWSTILVCAPHALPAIDKCGALRTICLTETTCFPRLRIFLERSNSSPLTLHLDIRSPSWFFHPDEFEHPFTPEHMSALLDHLLPHLDRWEVVEVISDTWAPLDMFLKRCSRPELHGIERQARMLRRVGLSRCNAYFALEGTRFSPSGLKTFLVPFKDAPLLRSVTLAGVHVDWGHRFLRNLTDLSLNYHAQEVLPSPSELADIINSSPNLESLSILGWGVRSFDDDSSGLEGSIWLKNVRQITIGWVSAPHSLRLLALFAWHMPELRSVTLEDVANSLDPISTQESSCIIDYISTRLSKNDTSLVYHCGLVELTLNSVCASIDSLHRLMEGLSGLQSITLHNSDDALLSILHPLQCRAENGSILCPELTRIMVRTAGCVSRVELERMVRARKTACGAPLSSTPSISLEIEDLLVSDAEIGLPSSDILDGDSDVIFYDGDSGLLLDEDDASDSEDELKSKGSSFSSPPPYATSADDHEHNFKLTRTEDCWPIVADEVARKSLVGIFL